MKLWSWAVLCAVLSSATTALAQPADAQARSLAKAQFAEGQRAFDRKDFDEALRHFRRAFELHRHDAVRFNIAVCFERLGRFREALEQYEAAAQSSELDAKQKQRATTKIDALRAELGTLEVDGSPMGAEVVVADEVLCTLPCKALVDPGELTVVVRRGSTMEERKVRVERQRTATVTVELKLDAPGATSSVQDAPIAVAPPEDAPPAVTRGPGWVTWMGAGLVVVGGVGVVAFGPKAQSEHDQFIKTGSEDARSSGERARDLTNVSIGVAVVGAALVAVDLLFIPKQGAPAATRRRPGMGLSF
ncbi:MAG: tetratricopeptide repeat protein [Polyangiaceae bacterium]|nr:tetratricopeptide repeat protein [Polyangiaceae bacterium]